MEEDILEKNKEFARKIMRAISTNDWKFVEDHFADNAVIWVAGSMPISGTHNKEFLKTVKRNQDFFPDGMTLTPKAMTAEGDRVAVEAETYGKFINGKLYNNHFHFLFVIRNGKIHEWREYMDTMHANDVFFSEQE